MGMYEFIRSYEQEKAGLTLTSKEVTDKERKKSTKIVERIPKLKEEDFKLWVWCNKNLIKSYEITPVIFNNYDCSLVRGITLKDRSDNTIAEEYFRADCEIFDYLERVLSDDRRSKEMPFKVKLTTVPNHTVYLIVPEFEYKDDFSATVTFDEIKEVEVYKVNGTNDMDCLVSAKGNNKEDKVTMIQELFFEAKEDAELALKLIKRAHPDGYSDDFDEIQNELRAWFGDSLYKYCLTATHNKYEWIDNITLNSYGAPIEVYNTYISRMLFEIGDNTRGIEYQLAPVLVNSYGVICEHYNHEVQTNKSDYEVICKGNRFRLCSFTIKPGLDMKETTEYKIENTLGNKVKQ